MDYYIQKSLLQTLSKKLIIDFMLKLYDSFVNSQVYMIKDDMPEFIENFMIIANSCS